MSFSTGLLKTASARSAREALKPIENVVAQAASIPTRIKHRTKSIGKGLGHFQEAVSRGMQRGARLSPVSGKPKSLPGEQYAKAHIKHVKKELRKDGKPMLSGEVEKIRHDAPAEVRARQQKQKREGKPSLWQRHPALTFGAGYVGAKAIAGDGKEEQKPSPYVVYPNQ